MHNAFPRLRGRSFVPDAAIRITSVSNVPDRKGSNPTHKNIVFKLIIYFFKMILNIMYNYRRIRYTFN